MILPPEQRPVLQMQMAVGPYAVGWVFTDETEYCQAPAFVLPWNPYQKLSDFDYLMPCDVGGHYASLILKKVDDFFLLEFNQDIIRFAIRDPFVHQNEDAEFLKPHPYIGHHTDLLIEYGLQDDAFLYVPIEPLDLERMDYLFTSKRAIFVGVTPIFGPHEPDAISPKRFAKVSQEKYAESTKTSLLVVEETSAAHEFQRFVKQVVSPKLIEFEILLSRSEQFVIFQAVQQKMDLLRRAKEAAATKNPESDHKTITHMDLVHVLRSGVIQSIGRSGKGWNIRMRGTDIDGDPLVLSLYLSDQLSDPIMLTDFDLD